VTATATKLLLLLAAALAAAGCTPEKDCRSGLQQLRPRVEGAVNTGPDAEAQQQISQAYADLTAAEEAAARGDFAACNQKIESARVLINKSQRH
jgi:hypothetical protein